MASGPPRASLCLGFPSAWWPLGLHSPLGGSGLQRSRARLQRLLRNRLGNRVALSVGYKTAAENPNHSPFRKSMWGRRSCEPLCSGGRGGPVSGPPAAPSSEAQACSRDPACFSLRKSQVSPYPRVILDLVAPRGWFSAALESPADPAPLFLPPRCWEEAVRPRARWEGAQRTGPCPAWTSATLLSSRETLTPDLTRVSVSALATWR